MIMIWLVVKPDPADRILIAVTGSQWIQYVGLQ